MECGRRSPIAKTELTQKIEKNLYEYTNKQGTFGCFEVTIGWFGSERVDYITYDTKGTWRCYEIKVSKSDFYSSAKKTFIGHFNYFVMPKELYEQVKDDIPSHVGVITDGKYSIKKAKRQELSIDEKILKDSLIRSLSRDADKLYKSNDPEKLNRMNRRITKAENERNEWRDKYHKLMNIGYAKYGVGWHRE
ncbi:hypothetical protein [Paenibacillus sp. XY044]|uniref:hypothetical protein n=1 Tax=Paenibacillus sp. XY044 TaxID=2026089 RepID=UPI000B984B29|nr:hypothetical protein [Paenibacillus sp. XY044]OZB98095.1 hypothetical protein CJP46_02705 [Paenibacillus sp. XY044]